MKAEFKERWINKLKENPPKCVGNYFQNGSSCAVGWGMRLLGFNRKDYDNDYRDASHILDINLIHENRISDLSDESEGWDEVIKYIESIPCKS